MQQYADIYLLQSYSTCYVSHDIVYLYFCKYVNVPPPIITRS